MQRSFAPSQLSKQCDSWMLDPLPSGRGAHQTVLTAASLAGPSTACMWSSPLRSVHVSSSQPVQRRRTPSHEGVLHKGPVGPHTLRQGFSGSRGGVALRQMAPTPHRASPQRVRSQSKGSDAAEQQPSLTPSSSGSNEASLAAPAHKWSELALWLFLAGFTLGAPLDGLHSLVGLQIYDGPGAITIGTPVDGLLTSLWVPPLLGAMYVVVGALQLLLDDRFPSAKDTPAADRSLVQVVVHLGVLVGLLRLSSLMYESDFSPLVILGVLLVFCQGSWYCFDRTAPGYLLALFVAVAAPLSEIVCIK